MVVEFRKVLVWCVVRGGPVVAGVRPLWCGSARPHHAPVEVGAEGLACEELVGVDVDVDLRAKVWGVGVPGISSETTAGMYRHSVACLGAGPGSV